MNGKEADELIAAIWQYIRANPETAFVRNMTGTLRFDTTDATADLAIASYPLDSTGANTTTLWTDWRGQDNSSANWRP